MKLIHFFLFSVFVGVAFCKELECLGKEIPACLQKIEGTKDKDADLCLKAKEMTDCFESSAKICKDEGQKAIKDLVTVVKELCDVNSQTHKDFQNYGTCLQKPAFKLKFTLNCLAEYNEEMQNLGEPDESNMEEYSKKVMKFICPKRENIVNCGYGQMKAECGEPAQRLFMKIFSPIDELLKESCDSASIPGISMALIFLQLLFTFFSSRRVF
ncbi:uncharacterized protein LOC129961757 [Argiope bruennichi]|uniref:uncharacterized protein LOC129961757 n=1 Tax=Argiope bruennichi TaxID=94029 RepID=UPI00249466AE|nr:uncharacterized protein LOC129961757 [Argiope bruennichi]